MFRVLCWMAVFSGVLLAGCSTISLDVHPALADLPEVKKSPLHAGVYYSPQFAAYEHVRKNGDIAIHVRIGAASVQYFDGLFPRLFEKTSRVESLSSEELAKKGVDVVISPSIEHFDFPMGFEPYSPQYGVAYRITLFTARGVPVASWVVSGTADHRNMLGGHLEAYVQNAGTQFLGGFERESASALAAIASHRAATAGIDTASLGLSARRTELAELGQGQVERLRAARFVCVQVTMLSKTARPLVIRASDMHLRLKDGRVIDSLPPSSLLEAIATESPVTTAVVPSVVGVLANLAASSAASSSSHNQREGFDNAVGQAFFGERILRQDAGEDGGIVFFRLPQEESDEGATVTAWVVDPASVDGAQVDMPLLAATPLR